MQTQPTNLEALRLQLTEARALLRSAIAARTRAILAAQGAPAVSDPYSAPQSAHTAGQGFGEFYTTLNAAITAKARAEVAAEKEYAAATRSLAKATATYRKLADAAAAAEVQAAIQAGACPTCFTVPSASGACLCS